MTETELGATKDYLTLRIAHFNKVIKILQEGRVFITAQPALEFMDVAIRSNEMIVQELKGVATHLKINLYDTGGTSNRAGGQV